MPMTAPLTRRNATELQAKAMELLSMSTTARTADTRDALERLAARFARLAESRIHDGVLKGVDRTATSP
jgi:hypothetical protein